MLNLEVFSALECNLLIYREEDRLYWSNTIGGNQVLTVDMSDNIGDLPVISIEAVMDTPSLTFSWMIKNKVETLVFNEGFTAGDKIIIDSRRKVCTVKNSIKYIENFPHIVSKTTTVFTLKGCEGKFNAVYLDYDKIGFEPMYYKGWTLNATKKDTVLPKRYAHLDYREIHTFQSDSTLSLDKLWCDSKLHEVLDDSNTYRLELLAKVDHNLQEELKILARCRVNNWNLKGNDEELVEEKITFKGMLI